MRRRAPCREKDGRGRAERRRWKCGRSERGRANEAPNGSGSGSGRASRAVAEASRAANDWPGWPAGPHASMRAPASFASLHFLFSSYSIGSNCFVWRLHAAVLWQWAFKRHGTLGAVGWAGRRDARGDSIRRGPRHVWAGRGDGHCMRAACRVYAHVPFSVAARCSRRRELR